MEEFQQNCLKPIFFLLLVECPMQWLASVFPLKVKVLVTQSWLTLFANPWTVADQAPLSMGFLMQEYWSGVPFPPPRDLPKPGIEPTSPAMAGNLYHLSHPLCSLWWPLNSSFWHLWLLLLLAAFIGKDVGGGFMWLEDLSLLSWFEDFLLHQCRKPVGNRSRLSLWEPVWELQVYFPGAWRAYGKEWGLGLLRGL